jgi:hypothetical protein
MCSFPFLIFFPLFGRMLQNYLASLSFCLSFTNKVALCTMWLQEFCCREHLHGGMVDLGPPIVAGLFQSVSDGMMGYNQARKVAYVPFPFPHAQITSLFVLVVVGLMPVYWEVQDKHALDSGQASSYPPPMARWENMHQSSPVTTVRMLMSVITEEAEAEGQEVIDTSMTAMEIVEEASSSNHLVIGAHFLQGMITVTHARRLVMLRPTKVGLLHPHTQDFQISRGRALMVNERNQKGCARLTHPHTHTTTTVLPSHETSMPLFCR